MSEASGAEIIHLDQHRRGGGHPEDPDDGRARCTRTRGDGSTCGLYLAEDGHCVVCEPGSRAVTEAGDQAETDRATAELRTELESAVRHVLAFARRRLTGAYEVDEFGFDTELTEQVILPLLRPLYQRWWRVRCLGIDSVPAEGAGLIVGNHAGTVPFDSLMTKVAVFDEPEAPRHLRELAADLALKTPFVGPLARRTGNTRAGEDDALRLLDAGELVGVWPEGFKGIGKHYRDRYKLQRFGRGGFVQTAIRAGAPIIPAATVGSEEIYPIIADLRPLARLLDLPYFPITWQFPLAGPLAAVPLPSKWVIEFGEPIPTDHLGAEAADDPMLVFEMVDRVRDVIQQMLYRNLLGRRSIFF